MIKRSALARWAPIPLRLIVGYGFMQHGFAKMSRGPDAFAAILHALGVPAPHFMAWVTILTELFWRLGGSSGRIRDTRQCTDGGTFVGGDFHGASA